MSDLPSSVTTTPEIRAAGVLERLGQWSQAFAQRLNHQLTFLEAIEQDLLVHLRTYYSQDLDPRFVQDLLDAALQRLVSQRPVVYEALEHAPYRIDEVVFQEVPSERREVVEQVVESVGSGMTGIYNDYLTRHWLALPPGLADASAYHARVTQLCQRHCHGLETLLAGEDIAGMTCVQIRQAIEAQERAWHEQPALLTLADTGEKEILDALVRAQMPDWHRQLQDAEVTALSESLQARDQALLAFERALGDARSLRDHARALATQHLRDASGLELSADLVSITREPLHTSGGLSERLSLTEQVMQGVIDVTQTYLPLQVSMPPQHCQAPTRAQINALLGTVDAPATYLKALQRRHADPQVQLAMLDAQDAQLRYSLLVASMAGHLSSLRHAQVDALLAGTATGGEVWAWQFSADAPCSDLLVFQIADDALVLHAPSKPDGQEWVEVPSRRALNAEIGGWFTEEAGRQYLLDQVPYGQRDAVSKILLQAFEKPSEWSLDLDRQQAPRGYQNCLKEGVRQRMQRWQDHVSDGVSPAYLAELSLQERQVLGLERQVAWQAERAFAAAMKGYEGFQAFARRTVADAIAPYLLEKGISESVDPESIIFDLDATAGRVAPSMNLVDLVCYGYDDNAGLDHPDKRVRSLVGQDLSALRSAELTYYARRAYIGEKYIAAVRAAFLDETSSDYTQRQQLFGRALIAALDRDLRLAKSKGQIDVQVFAQLTAQVSALGKTLELPKSHSDAETVVSDPGIFRLSIDGCVVLGCYVLRYVMSDTRSDWLYTPDAPDGLLLREYAALNAAGSGALRDYLLNRVTLASRTRVTTRLQRLAANSSYRDSLREMNQVRTVAGEFDAFIEHALTDVDDATHSRAEVIRGQVFKGALFAAFPLLVYPPFALVFSAAFVVAPLRSAIVAHTRGETAIALRHWLEASWQALGPALSLPGLSLATIKPLLPALRRAVRGRATVSGAVRTPSMRFDKAWAVKDQPANLTKVVEEGIWKGTYRSDAAEGAAAEHFILSGKRYYKVLHDAEAGTLRVLKANRPTSLHREAVTLHADGRWVANSTGLRGGNHVQDAGTLSQVRQISGGSGAPSAERGAFQGEVVIGRHAATATDNYLYTVNAQTCVAVSLYNPATRAGAVLHVDHNIISLIEPAVRRALSEIGAAQGGSGIRAVMAGGDWLGGADIGGALRSLLRRNGVQAQWQHWSYSSCFGNTYGMTLDLASGVTRVYRTPEALVRRLYEPLLKRASASGSDLQRRAAEVLARVRSRPLYQGSDGVVRNEAGEIASESAKRGHALNTVMIG